MSKSPSQKSSKASKVQAKDAMSLSGLGLPGLGIEEPSEQPQAVDPVTRNLPAGSEWRFEVAFGKYVQVRLLSGEAELFGSELSDGPVYTFTGTKAAIFTHDGCTLETSNDAPQSEYTAEETPMIEYVNLHFALESLRSESETHSQVGPRILILGPSNAGKTSLAKLLTAYAIRSDRQPIVINLDTKEGLLSLPGTLTAVPFKTMLDIEDGWGSSPLSGPSAIPVKLPLVYSYGLPDPTINDSTAEQYKSVLSKLALAVTGRLNEDALAATAGLVIDSPPSLANTPSPIAGSIIENIITEFSVSHIAILGSERLYSDMLRTWDGKPTSTTSTSRPSLPNGIPNSQHSTPSTITVAKLSKSGGCVDRDASFLAAHRAAQIKSYFFGPPTPPNTTTNPENATIASRGPTLSPRQQQVDFSSLKIYSFRSSQSNFPPSGGDLDLGMGFDGVGESAPGAYGDDDTAPNSSSAATLLALDSDNNNSSNAGGLLTPLSHPSLSLVSHILTIVDADPETSPFSEKNALDAPVLGFVYVADITGLEAGRERAKVTLLTPVPGRVPKKVLIWSERFPGLVNGVV